MKPPIVYTEHAIKRMAQRNVSEDQIAFILQYGYAVHRAGAVLVSLRDKDIPKTLRADDQFARLAGTTVVLSRDEPLILTVWRNRDKGLQHIRQKSRFSY